MASLVLGTLIGLGIGLPQVLPALRYYPQSTRSLPHRRHQGVPLRVLVNGLLTPTPCDQTRGLFFPEVCVFTGWLPLLSAWYAPWSYWHGVLLIGVVGALGHWMPPGFRLPARFCWLIGLSVAMLGLHGLATMALSLRVLTVLILTQAASLLLACWTLLPMSPFCQRWERPSVAFGTPLARYLQHTAHPGRVSGLPYPLRTGQINRIHTLGYNGGSQPRWMARFRRDRNPDGTGAHDWFALNHDGPLLDWYGVRFACTLRPLPHRSSKWQPTPFPHLYENRAANPFPSWSVVQERFGC